MLLLYLFSYPKCAESPLQGFEQLPRVAAALWAVMWGRGTEAWEQKRGHLGGVGMEQVKRRC